MATTPTSPFTFALVGAGRVGTAVAVLLSRAGHEPIAVASRSAESSERAAELLGSQSVDIEGLPPVDVVLVGTPDNAIEATASKFASRLVEGTVVIHFAGSLGVDPLGPVLSVGARRAALHPVQACPDIESAIERIPGSGWGVTCDEGLAEWCIDLVENDLDGHAFRVRDEHRAVWHAAAVVVSNGIAGLLATGEELLASIGIGDPGSALGPLAAGTLENARVGGGGGTTLTGPAVRGERDTIARHLDGIARVDGELLHPYGLATVLTIQAAVRAGRIEDHRAQEMLTLLRERT